MLRPYTHQTHQARFTRPNTPVYGHCRVAASAADHVRPNPWSPVGILAVTHFQEPLMFSRMRSLGLAAVVSALVATPALAGPPWISIELPANPYDQATRGAFLLVHAFHHGEPIGYLVTGTAEGIVGGERRSMKLEFSETSRDGVYALKRMWPTEGVWTLVIKANQGPDDAATAVIELGAEGEGAAIRVPVMQRGQGAVPPPGSLGEDEAARKAAARPAGRGQ